jgi:hypothetical protein
MLIVVFLFALIFDPEDGNDKFLRNVSVLPDYNNKQTNKQTNSGAADRQRTIPTKRRPLVGEVSDNFSG